MTFSFHFSIVNNNQSFWGRILIQRNFLLIQLALQLINFIRLQKYLFLRSFYSKSWFKINLFESTMKTVPWNWEKFGLLPNTECFINDARNLTANYFNMDSDPISVKIIYHYCRDRCERYRLWGKVPIYNQ